MVGKPVVNHLEVNGLFGQIDVLRGSENSSPHSHLLINRRVTHRRRQSRQARFLQSRAGSTGRCNTGLQFTRRRFKAQSLSRALIEAQSYLVEIGLSVTGQVGFLREVLS